MSFKSLLFILAIIVCAKADLFHIVAGGAITSLLEKDSIHTFGSDPTVVINETEVNGFSIGSFLQTEFTIDTDLQGYVTWGGDREYLSSTLSGEQRTESFYRPIEVSSSGFPDIYSALLNSDNNIELRYVKEMVHSEAYSASDYATLCYGNGYMSFDETGFDIGLHFINISIPSGLDAIMENQTVSIVEGFETRLLINGTFTSHMEILATSDAHILSITHTTNVPEPSSLSLLIAGCIFLGGSLYRQQRKHSTDTCSE